MGDPDSAATLEAPVALGRRRIAGYELIDLLGEGGMAVVFRAVAPSGEPVAIKVIRTTLTGGHARERFQREASIRLEHPNVVRVLDAGTDPDGTPFIAFELLDGESLAPRLARGRLGPEETIALGVDVCRGLEAVHALGVVHRDLKPANLFLAREGGVKVLDFGVAHLASRETQLTAHGHVVGTPAYLAPEQARGELAEDPRIDVWAVGAVLYECLTGAPPFEKDTALGTMLATLVEPLVPPSERADVPAGLERVIVRALAKRAADRWPTAAALGAALAAVDPHETAARRGVPESARGLIESGEQRVIVLALAEGVIDPGALRAAIEAHGGELLALAGERAIGLFGHRRTQGDEIRRAARAALAARPAALRVSVGTGRASDEGGGIAGEALRDAERGSGVWARGVVVSAAVARQLGETALAELGDGLFELRPEAAVRRTRGTVPEPRAAAILGREAELELLRAAERTALGHGRPTTVLVTGPLGIGKTRLLDELEVEGGRVGRVEVLHTAAEPHERESRFALLAGLTRAFVAKLGVAEEGVLRALREELAAHTDDLDVADEHARFLGELAGAPVPESPALADARKDPQLMQDRLHLAFTELIEALARDGGVLLRVEDLHWADEPSLRVLEELADRLAGGRLLSLFSARSELEATPRFGRGHLVSIRLEGLEPPDVAALARRVAGRPIAGPRLAELHERSSGNPGFVEQIVLSLVEDRALAGDGGELPLPLTVHVAVQSRLDHLPSDEKEACKRAAILDPPFSAAELGALGGPEPSAVIPALVRRGLVRRAAGPSGDARFRFTNELVRDVARDMIAAARRRELHRLAAEHLARSGERDLERVGAHFAAAEEPARAGAFYARATLGAARRSDTESVLRCAARALELGAPPELAFDLHFARADALRFRGEREAQGEALARALAHAATDLERARARVEQVALFTRTGRVTEAREAGPDAIAAARASGDAEVLAMALARSAAARIYAGEAAEADALLAEARARIDRVGPKSAAYVEAVCAELAAAQGKLGERRDAWQRAVRHLLDAGDLRLAASMESNLADLYNRVGMYAEAEAALEKAIERGRALGYRLLEGYASANLGYARMRAGDPERARAALADAERIARDVHDPRLELAARLYLARLDRSFAAAVDVGVRADGLEQPSTRAAADVVAGWAALEAGALDEAEARSARALATRDALGGLEEDEADVFLLRAAVLDALGRSGEARVVITRGVARLDEIAAGIEEPEWRRRFLDDVEAHRRLRAREREP